MPRLPREVKFEWTTGSEASEALCKGLRIQGWRLDTWVIDPNTEYGCPMLLQFSREKQSNARMA